MQKLAAYIAIVVFAISTVGCSKPKVVVYALNGFQLDIDTTIYEPIAAENPDLYSYEKWQPTILYSFKDRRSGTVLNFVYDSILALRNFSFETQVEKLEARAKGLSGESQYPLLCGQNNHIKYCLVTDTVHVKPAAFLGIIQSDNKEQMYFYSYITKADSIKHERDKLNSIIMAATFTP